jgi:hypothetical protein
MTDREPLDDDDLPRSAVSRAWLDNQPPRGPESYGEYVARWARIRRLARAAMGDEAVDG